MRVLFIIVSLFGLLLLGFSTIEIRKEREFNSRVRDVQRLLAELDAKAVAQARQEHSVLLLVPSYASMGAGLDRVSQNLTELDRAWFPIACGSAVIFVFGIAGIIIERKNHVHKVAPNTMVGCKS